jgi:hypothetical protein
MLDEAIGNSPYEHLYLLKETRDRTLSLKEIMSGIIKPGMSVLDLGTGALGNLAIMAAKMGATRVVGVDHGNVNIAREIAKENNVDVEFIQQDFKDLDLNGETFDVILGMIYVHEPWYNDGQQTSFKKCVEKFGHENTILVPDHVEYTGTGCGFGAINTQGLYDDISLVEEDSGITLNYLRNPDNFYYKKFLMSSLMPRAIGDVVKEFAVHEALTEPVRLAYLDYTSEHALEQRPKTLQLKVIEDGWLTAIKWDMAIMHKDKLIRKAGHPSQILNPKKVVKGEIVTISIPQDTSAWIMSNGKVSICG